MTDKEQVINICKKLNLEHQQEIVESVHFDEYHVSDRNVFIGSGLGYAGFWVNFIFDGDGNLIDHGIWE